MSNVPGPDGENTHVAGVYYSTLFSPISRIVGERVRWNGRRIVKAAAASTGGDGSATTPAAVAASAAAKATSEATTTTTKATTTGREAAATKATAETTTTATKRARSGKAIFPDLQHSALPVVTVELLDGIARIIWAFKRYDTGTLWAATWIDMNVGTDNCSLLCCPPIPVNIFDPSEIRAQGKGASEVREGELVGRPVTYSLGGKDP